MTMLSTSTQNLNTHSSVGHESIRLELEARPYVYYLLPSKKTGTVIDTIFNRLSVTIVMFPSQIWDPLL